MTGTITILIADDHPLFRKGLRQAIEAEPSFRIVDEAKDGESALRKMVDLRPAVAILDIDMPGKNGFEVAKEAAILSLPVSIIFLTMYKEEDMFSAAMDLGTKGYVLKENAGSDIIDAIRAVAGGKYYISPLISDFLVRRGEQSRLVRKQHPLLETLTPAERRILKLISENSTSKQIAELLHISPKTVENHRVNIVKKLNLQGAHSLLKFALENKSLL
jgi:DNA-binding NarL/FixJ family response regulator